MLFPSLYLLAFLFAESLASPIAAGHILSFNNSLDGRLKLGVPFARACFAVAPHVAGSRNDQECQDIVNGYLDHDVRLAAFGGYMNTEWETCQATGEGCLLNPSNTSAHTGVCRQGSVPSFYIEIETAADRIHIVVKNTGHDYTGRSSGPGTLALWVRSTLYFTLFNYTRNFVSSGCKAIPVPAITIGAGVTHGTVYQFAEKMNITIPGGGDATVGASGGYLQLEFELVTPDGKHVIANSCQNPDLLFALRGGGHGFGVVLKATVKVLPKLTMTTANHSTEVIEFMVLNALSYADQGWNGYIVPTSSIILTSPLQTLEKATQSLASFRMFIEGIGGTFELSSDPSWLSFFNRVLVPVGVPVGVGYVTSSRLIPTSSFTTAAGRDELIKGLLQLFRTPDTIPVVFMVAPHYFKDAGGTSVTDAWRTSLWHVTSSAILPTTGVISVYRKLTKSMDVLRKISPTSGAYANEADVYEPNFSQSFWGSHYDRLLTIKRKYDPDHLLDCWHCGTFCLSSKLYLTSPLVDWKGMDDPRYSCYPRI
ncbi:FAD-binding domain-containing protein [Mycena olivaceomarginata]|nr:FAD-binding domain-containing protein [Mycena olivaceomarginata]